MRKQLTDEEISHKIQEREMELLDTYTSWEPLSSEYIYDIATGEITRLLPTIWQRDDGRSLLYPGRTHVFLGETESCKTFVTNEIMAQEIVKGNVVIFVDLEDAAITAVERLLQLGLAAEEIRDGFLYLNPHDVFDDVARSHLEQRIVWTNRTATFVVIDSMTEAMSMEGLDPDRGLQVSEFYRNAPRWFAESLGAAVVIIDHVAKKTKNSNRFAIGSERKISGLTGAAYQFTKLKEFGRGMTGTVKVTVSKDRPGSIRPIAVKGKELGVITLCSSPETGDVEISFEASSGQLDLAAEARMQEAVAHQLRRDAWAVIEANPGIGSTELREKMDGDTGKKKLRRTVAV